MNELALFAGAGGGILGGAFLGWRTVCAVERDAYCAQVLAQRQNDRSLPPFPIWSDVQSFDGRPWRGIVDVVSGGFPCQDISTAGKGAGIDGERSGLWRHMARIIGEVRPGFVLVENVTALVSRGLERVLGDLSALGYDATWTVVGAADVGAPHQRDRIWIVAHTRSVRFDQVEHKLPEGEQNARRSGQNVSNAVRNGRPELEVQQVGEQRRSAETYARHDGPQGSMAHANGIGKQQSRRRVKKKRGRSFDCSEALAFPDRERLAIGEGQREDRIQELTPIAGKGWWAVEPSVGRVVDGMAARVDRLRALGNGQVPLSMVEAWQRLTR